MGENSETSKLQICNNESCFIGSMFCIIQYLYSSLNISINHFAELNSNEEIPLSNIFKFYQLQIKKENKTIFGNLEKLFLKLCKHLTKEVKEDIKNGIPNMERIELYEDLFNLLCKFIETKNRFQPNEHEQKYMTFMNHFDKLHFQIRKLLNKCYKDVDVNESIIEKLEQLSTKQVELMNETSRKRKREFYKSNPSTFAKRRKKSKNVFSRDKFINDYLIYEEGDDDFEDLAGFVESDSEEE